MASIRKTKTKKGDDRYVVSWRADGRLVEQWFTTVAAAKARRVEIEHEALGGREVDPRPGRQTLNDYFDAWLPARLVAGRPLRPSTRHGYEGTWRRIIRPSIGRRQLRTIRPDAVRKWHGEVSATKGQDQAAKAYRLLHAVMATAAADDLIRDNPCRIRGAGQEHADERPLAESSLVLDIAEAINERVRALVLLVAFASTRPGEALGGRRLDVDLLHSEFHVIKQAQELNGRRTELDYTKSEAGRRTIALPQLVVDALDEHLQRFTAPDPASPIFTGPRGGPLRRATLSRWWREAKKAVGAPEELRLYDLRHYGATLAARTPGITLKELMRRIGHSSLAAALRYQHAAAERDRAVASYLDKEIGAVEQPPRGSVSSLDDAVGGES